MCTCRVLAYIFSWRKGYLKNPKYHHGSVMENVAFSVCLGTAGHGEEDAASEADADTVQLGWGSWGTSVPDCPPGVN